MSLGCNCGFEQVHPFIDGNGRTGRLLLNLVLVRLGLPPAIVFTSQREQHLRALRRGDQDDFGQLGEFMVAGPARLVPIAALGRTDISSGALRTAAVRGAWQATKGPDGQWRSCRNWVEDYLANKHKHR